MSEQAKMNAYLTAMLRPSMFKKDFLLWLKENYHVFEYFEKSAMQVWEHGFKSYGARTIVEVMRHRSNVREIGNGEWKLNNNRTPDMAKLYMLLHPEQRGFFKIRSRRAA